MFTNDVDKERFACTYVGTVPRTNVPVSTTPRVHKHVQTLQADTRKHRYAFTYLHARALISTALHSDTHTTKIAQVNRVILTETVS